jgi:hypothetical protein
VVARRIRGLAARNAQGATAASGSSLSLIRFDAFFRQFLEGEFCEVRM